MYGTIWAPWLVVYLAGGAFFWCMVPIRLTRTVPVSPYDPPRNHLWKINFGQDPGSGSEGMGSEGRGAQAGPGFRGGEPSLGAVAAVALAPVVAFCVVLDWEQSLIMSAPSAWTQWQQASLGHRRGRPE